MHNTNLSTEKELANQKYASLLAAYKVRNTQTRTVYPFCYDKNAPFTRAAFKKWLRHIRFELSMVTDYLLALELADCLDDEIAMEGLGLEALEILSK
jgi:hypothetical protein